MGANCFVPILQVRIHSHVHDGRSAVGQASGWHSRRAEAFAATRMSAWRL